MNAIVVAPADRTVWTVMYEIGVVAKRTLRRHLRTPQLLFFATVQPVMFVLLFNYVFGGAIDVASGRYVDFLMPGIFVQTVAFGGINTAMGLTRDVSEGIMTRFKSLPMSGIAVLAGRTIADAIRNVAVVLLMVVVGGLVGFRFHGGFVPALGAIGLAPLFGFALGWFFSFVGLSLREAETSQLAGFAVLFPLTFTGGVFTPVSAMPGWLQAFARNQPFTHVVDAMRALTQGGPVAHPLIMSLVWIAGISAVFAVLAGWRYRAD